VLRLRCGRLNSLNPMREVLLIIHEHQLHTPCSLLRALSMQSLQGRHDNQGEDTDGQGN
jgi:hypothetical protein